MPASEVRVAGETEGSGEARKDAGCSELACHPPVVGDGSHKLHETSL